MNDQAATISYSKDTLIDLASSEGPRRLARIARAFCSAIFVRPIGQPA
jgi:hypothetical protein